MALTEPRPETRAMLTEALDRHLTEHGGGVAAWKDRDPPAAALAAVVLDVLDFSALEEALDDLWGCIGSGEIGALQPETVEMAKGVHSRLWHDGTVSNDDG